MNCDPDPRELHIVRSWHANAGAWSEAIRTASIASRKLVTNRAIIEAVSAVSPRRVLDIGCGEGWLARALASFKMQVIGIDAVPALVAQARALVGGEFHVQEYASIANRQLRLDPVDAVVCNFSLLGKESVEDLLGALPAYLNDRGTLIVQTLHPIAACGQNPYEDGWREGSWLGFGSEFSDPAPWYFRTLESWSAMLERCGFDILERREPMSAGADAPASVIWICKARGSAQTGQS
jgi:2-polyprenyl-3-methyl-5-hydroxy-6-metoxy-1,4-benzoquinol methylase